MTSLRRHLPEYAMEGGLLGGFMVAACAFAALLEHPASPVRQALPDATVRRLLMGAAMGATAVVLVLSPWGQQSGAHMNPSLTLAFLRLGKIARADAAGYVVGQFAGGLAGVLGTWALLGVALEDPRVHFAVTVPGPAGTAAAFAAEVVISGVLMLAVLVVSNDRRWARWTPWCCGLLVAVYIAVEAPLSGMSMNPARTLASALAARDGRALWIYFTAPPLGMLLAAEAYVDACGLGSVLCAKLNHRTSRRCIFRCRWHEAA
jgi:aquaporin Z